MVAFFSKWLTANHLTTLRVVLVPFIYVGIVIGEDDQWILLGTWMVFLIACLTDYWDCLLYTSPSPRDRTRSRMPSSA